MSKDVVFFILEIYILPHDFKRPQYMVRPVYSTLGAPIKDVTLYNLTALSPATAARARAGGIACVRAPKLRARALGRASARRLARRGT